MRSSNKLLRGVLILVFGLGVAGFVGPSSATTEETALSLPIATVADYLHAVIEADREVYTRHVVERLQAKGVVVASENWEEMNTLPLPAQFLMESGRIMAKQSIGIQYRLISLWPINKRNVARSEFEKEGLGTILTHPTKPYTGFVMEGGARYFQAVYPDLAVTQACIGCHNAHPDSPKRDFKIDDVMGAIVISIPAVSATAQAHPRVRMNLVDENGVGKEIGQVTISETEYGLVFSPAVTGLPPGLHGFHVHENASCEPKEKDGKKMPALAAGGHYDPAGSKRHSGPGGDGHLGDLPALFANANGNTSAVLAPRLKMADLKGRALMIHAGGDNYADQPAPLGGGGARWACGVIPVDLEFEEPGA